MEANHEIIRKAGLLERYHITAYNLGFDSPIAVSAHYRHVTEQPLDKPKLYKALAKVLHKLPALCVHILHRSTNAPVFARLKSVTLSRVVEFDSTFDSSRLEECLEQLLARRMDMDSDDPLWRITVLRDNTVIFLYHHAIGDGQSGPAFHAVLSDALNSLDTDSALQDDIDTVPVPLDATIYSAVEEMTDVSVSATTFLHEMFGFLAPAFWKPNYGAWTGNPVTAGPHTRTNIRLLSLSPDDANTLLQLCRSHKATLTTAFHTIAINILSHLVLASTAERPRSICTVIPISLRQFTKVPQDAMCDHASTYPNVSPLISEQSPEFPWETAAVLTSKLRAFASPSRQRIGMLRHLNGRYEDYLKGMLGKKRELGLLLSNLGQFPARSSAEQQWTIGDVYFVQINPVVGPAIKLQVAGTGVGGVTIAVTWEEGVADDALGEAFTTGFRSAIEELIQGAKYN